MFQHLPFFTTGYLVVLTIITNATPIQPKQNQQQSAISNHHHQADIQQQPQQLQSLLGGQTAPYCNGMQNLTPGQLRICQSYPQLMPYVELGYRFAVQECMRQMSHRKWNCSIAVTDRPTTKYELAELDSRKLNDIL